MSYNEGYPIAAELMKQNTLDNEAARSKSISEIDAENIMDKLLKSTGDGSYNNQIQNWFSRMDRFGRNTMPANAVHSGMTFITRPCLNLTSASLRQSRVLTPLDTTNPRSTAFAIRCLLDTKFQRNNIDIVNNSPLLDPYNPFFIPLCKGLSSISGFPDVVIQTTTTEGGFHSEDLTTALGSDQLNKSYDLSLQFKDIPNGPILSIFLSWCDYIQHVTKGTTVAYKEHIDARQLNYTVSIYRFLLDPTRRFITHYAKASTAFPKSVPMGAIANMNENELYVEAAKNITIPFSVNKVEYNDYGIIMDFNRLVEKYCPHVAESETLAAIPINNYSGIPYIETGKHGIELVFKDVHN